MSVASSTLDVLCPFDGSRLRTLSLQTAEDAERMLERAESLFADRTRWLEPYQRIDILKRLAKRVDEESDDFARLIAAEGGKPLIDARIEVARAVDGIELAIKELPHVMRGEEIPMGLTAATAGRTAFTICEALGPVLAVSAFNHPLNLIVHQVIPAVAVGCPVIVKPAMTTPLCCLRLCELLVECGLPEDFCRPIICDNEVAQRLVTSSKIRFFSFIGSAKVGWMLKSQLAPGVRSALEHGGVAPVIVDHSADWDAMIPALLKGGFYHAGQVCVSVQRVYAPAEVAPKLAQQLAEGAAKLKVGDARLEDVDVGPLINPSEVDRVHRWVGSAVQEGAKLIGGGEKLTDSTYAPTVLLDPDDSSDVSTKEIFGPVVCVYSYQDRHEAIARANSLEVAFQASVFTKDLDIAFDSVQRLDATAVMINDHTAFRADWMPFAGRRHSGYGTGGIGYTMHDMLQTKMAVIRSAAL